MKKMLTLTFLIGAFATSFAQSNHRQTNDEPYAITRNGQYDRPDDNDLHRQYDNRNGQGNNANALRNRNYQIEKINRNYNYQVQVIESDRYMKRRDKKRAIRNAEVEKERQIQMVNAPYNNQQYHNYGHQYSNSR